jgi:hypothetical protein
MKVVIRILLFGLFCLQASSAENKKELGIREAENDASKKSTIINETVLGMNVSGNKELPNVLYIVPWKASSNFSNPPIATRLVEEIFAPVDPHAFTKKVKFYKQLTINKQLVETK